jgi:DNA mismatch repair protein MSH6
MSQPRIHSEGCYTHSNDHPDARAIFFEREVYSKRKIGDFVSILDGLSRAVKVADILKPALEE